MRSTWQIISTILLGLAAASAMGWVFWHAFRRSESPLLLGFKWLLTLGCLAFVLLFFGPLAGSGGLSSIVAVPAMAATGLVLAIIWRRNIAELIASQIASLYDDGKTMPDPKPVYSISLAKRKRGDYLEPATSCASSCGSSPPTSKVRCCWPRSGAGFEGPASGGHRRATIHQPAQPRTRQYRLRAE